MPAADPAQRLSYSTIGISGRATAVPIVLGFIAGCLLTLLGMFILLVNSKRGDVAVGAWIFPYTFVLEKFRYTLPNLGIYLAFAELPAYGIFIGVGYAFYRCRVVTLGIAVVHICWVFAALSGLS